ncbi:hypothetical protein [Paraburkholderia hospita]|uniref:hypothetical protein n=1 Tax=Paraburkholderia hospita TaxID=169430 RepID=UPI0002718B16|nr:hypothetical protein [Paraburkholderia hospita]EUC14735.1 hypothetical protein PMI06_006561 [Burkholderia sp. BT03]SKC94011.1 hypothetical protein SAMN06266956_5870 [Paraburkholderia hospita]
MENAVYWQGKQVGIEGTGGRISWFPSAPREAIAALDPRRAESPSGQRTAANLGICADIPKR